MCGKIKHTRLGRKRMDGELGGRPAQCVELSAYQIGKRPSWGSASRSGTTKT